MFKKLKDKIAEEVKQSPSKISATVSQLAQAVVSPSSSSIVEPSSISDLNFSISEDAEDQSSPAKQGFTSVDLREESTANAINMMRSRHSSTSSLVSDNASFFPHYEPHGSSFHLQSDLESASEMDDSYSTQATSTSKEQLVALLRKSQQRYNKYKGRYADLAKHYRELERDNYKAKSILSESQDKALRRIAELKEQCQLEQRAKAHLEEILRNDLEEKDHLIMTLNTKIDLLKLNDSPQSLETSLSSNAPAELNTQSGDVQNFLVEGNILADVSDQKDSTVHDSSNELGDAARDKVKKLEVLLAKCKDAIKIHKEKVKEYSTDNEQLKIDLLAAQETSSRQLKNLEAAQAEIVWLKKREEESALSLAETKRSIHSEMEIKEEQMKHLRQSIQDLNAQRDEMGNKLEDQVTEMKQTQEVEKSSDNEKQIQELSRVKQEAMKILQSKYNESVSDLKTTMGTKIGELEGQIKELTETNQILETNSKTSQEQLEKQIKELTESYQRLEDESKTSQEQLEKQIRELTETNQFLETNSKTSQERLEKQIKEFTESYQRLEDERKTSQEHLEKQIRELTETNQFLETNSKTSQEQLEKQIKELTESYQRLEDERKTSQDQLEKQIEELTETNQLLEAKSKTSQEQLEQQIKELTQTNDSLQSTAASSQEELKSNVANAFALQSQIKQLEEDNNCLQTKVRVAEVQATLHDNASESKYTENMETLEIVIANLQESHSQLQTQYSALQKTVIEKDNKIDMGLAELKRLLDDNAALSTINARLDSQVQDLAAALSSANICVSKVRLQLLETQQKHESVNSANESEIKSLADNIHVAYEKVASLEVESGELKKTIGTHEESLVELRAHLSTAQEQLQKTSVSLDQVSATRLEIERDLNARISQMSDKQEVLIREHDEQLRLLQADMELKENELKTGISKLTIQKEELSARIDTLNAENEKLTSQLTEKLSELSSQKEELAAVKESIVLNDNNLSSQHAIEQERLKSLQKELTEEVNLLKLDNERLFLQLDEKQAELKTMKEEFVTREALMNENNVQFESSFSEAQTELQSKTEQLVAQEQKLKLLSTDKEKLEMLLAEKQIQLTSQSEEFSAKVKSLDSDNEKLKCALAESQAALTIESKCASVVADKQAEIEKISLELSQLQGICSNATSEKAVLLAELNESRKEFDGKCNELAALRKKLEIVDEVTTKLATITEQLNYANTENSRLSAQLEQNTVCHEKLSEKLNEKLASMKSDLEIIRGEKLQLEKELNMQASQGTDLSEVVKQFQNEKQQSCSQFEELQVKLESQEQDIDQLTQRLNESTVALQQKIIEFDENEELQRQKIKLLARNFEEKLHFREEELSKLFDEERAKLESTEGIAVNQLRTHIKALKSEVRQAEDTIASLNKQNKDLIKQQQAEILALEEKLKDSSLANEFEIRECEQKWRSSLEKELSERDMIHKEEVNALSKEWSMERKTNNSTDIPSPNQELESTSKVAVAAVESGTGSIDLMHRQLLSITRELNDAKRRHKLETVELRRIIENRTKGSETTELEYLRNILFEYMMGREPTVLARVIAAVLKFDQEQTNKIIEKEEHKQSLLGHLGIL